MPFRMKITGREDVLEASLRIKEHGNPKAVRKELNRALKEAAEPAVADVKEAALNLPAKSHRMILRQRIANSASAQVRSSGKHPTVKVRVSRARMKDKAPVPQLMDRGPFRHPVFGRDKWVPQDGHKGWFEHAVDKSRPEVQARIHEAAERIVHGINKH